MSESAARLLTFGGATLLAPTGEPVALQPRRLAILAVLARADQRGVTRERLLQLFWPDDDEEKARRALAQALYSLRRDLGDDGAVTGTQQLRLDSAVLPSDVALFGAHVRSGHLDEAAALYRGPFLQGFHLLGVPEFERWADEERTVLAREHARVIERLATTATRDGRFAEAAVYWRTLAAVDPLDARVTVQLMEALESAGDRAGALKQARIYEALIAQELELPPDRVVVDLAARLRAAPEVRSPLPVAVASTREPAPPPAPIAIDEVATEPDVVPSPEPVATVAPASSTPPSIEPAASPAPVNAGAPTGEKLRHPWTRLVAVAAAVVVTLGGYMALRDGRSADSTADSRATSGDVLAVGRIMDFREKTPVPAGAVIDLLSTDLARIPGVQVLSNARMMELTQQLGGSDTQDRSAAAARAGGATEVLEGSVQRHADGQLQLDLRRVAVATGTVRAAYRVVGNDVFALVRDATDSVATGARQTLAARDSATVNPVAFGFYEQGLRAIARGNPEEGARFFGLAVEADSSFALAIYYLWSATESSGGTLSPATLDRLAQRASAGPGVGERERLMLRTASAYANRRYSAFIPLADSLIQRYPNEVEGYYLRGLAEMVEAHYERALPDLYRVVRMDSLSLRGASARCRACDANALIVEAFVGMDSLAAAERLAKAWARQSSDSLRPLWQLVEIYGMQGKAAESIALIRRLTAMSPSTPANAVIVPAMRARAGELTDAEIAARLLVRDGDAEAVADGYNLLVLALREQGRVEEAVRVVRAWTASQAVPERRNFPSLLEAQLQFEQGRFREAGRTWLAAFAGRARAGISTSPDAWAAAATSFAYAGDVVNTRRASDSAMAVARRLNTDVASKQAQHAQAMVALVLGDTLTAIARLEGARYAPTRGFTRTYFELARLYAARGRSREALAAIAPALHAPMSGPSVWVAHLDLHALAARESERVGRRVDAREQWLWIAKALSRPDSSRAALKLEATARLSALVR